MITYRLQRSIIYIFKEQIFFYFQMLQMILFKNYFFKELQIKLKNLIREVKKKQVIIK